MENQNEREQQSLDGNNFPPTPPNQQSTQLTPQGADQGANQQTDQGANQQTPQGANQQMPQGGNQQMPQGGNQGAFQGNQPGFDNVPPLKPNNWLWQSIVATICCCLPFGIVGIIYAVKVDSLYFNGRYEEAIQNAGKAKMWSIIALIAGLSYLAIYFILLIAGILPNFFQEMLDNSASGYNF